MQLNTLDLVNDFAPGYDSYINRCRWYGPEMLFGLMYEFISPGETLLDLGIGTGLSALPFHKAGLKIYGLDGSQAMLQLCEKKNIAQELKQCDFSNPFIPFEIEFNHIISYAVFHFLFDIQPLLSKISEKLIRGGIFGFSADVYNPSTDKDYLETSVPGIYIKTQQNGPIIYKHTIEYLENTLTNTGFRLIKTTYFLAFQDLNSQREVYFQLIIAAKQ